MPIGRTILASAAAVALSVTDPASAIADGAVDPSYKAETLGPDYGGDHYDIPCEPIARPSGNGFLVPIISSTGTNQAAVGVIARHADGSPDLSVGPGGFTLLKYQGLTIDAQCGAFAAGPGGKFYVLGFQNGVPGGARLFRYQSTGVIDPAFPAVGTGAVVGLLATLPDGRFAVANSQPSLGSQNIEVYGLDADGSPDFAFGDGGASITVAFDAGGTNDDIVRDIKVALDGRIFVGATVSRTSPDTDFGIAALLPNGMPDLAWGNAGKFIVPFDAGGGKADTLGRLVVNGDGRVAAVGNVETSSALEPAVGVAMFTPQGALDAAFDGNGRRTFAFSGSVGQHANDAQTTAFDDRGRLIVGGTFRNGLGSDSAIARLLPTGAFDPNFAGGAPLLADFGFGASDRLEALWLQHQSNPIVVGHPNTSTELDVFVARVTGDVVVRDGFE